MPQTDNQDQVKCEKTSKKKYRKNAKDALSEAEEKLSRLRMSRLKYNPDSCTGNQWSLTQNMRYLHFLIAKKDILSLPCQEKKILKTNVMMSKKIGTRTPNQCHSHHQKMVNKYGSIDSIIEELQIIKQLYVKRGSKKKVPEPAVKQLQESEKEEKQMKVESELMAKYEKTDVLKEEEHGDYRYIQ